MERRVALAAREMACLEFPAVSARMELVVAHYDDLAKLFRSVMPNMFSTPVRSDLKAKALGTWLQSEILAGVGRAGRTASARLISDRAIEEFCNRDDKERQYQYRSQLECSAGDFRAAREYLARSLRLDDFSHDRSEEHTSELQSLAYLVCRLLPE